MLNRSLIALLTALCGFILTGTVYAIPLPPTGTITTENTFLIGQNADDRVGSSSVFALPNGNLIVASPNWNGGRGAVTCLTPAEYTSSTPFVISESNSLVGSSPNDQVGGAAIALKNGNYLVTSPLWDNGATADVGAVTWVNGTTCHPFGETSRGAVVSASNSLTGSQTGDRIGSNSTIILSNGNALVRSYLWDNGAVVDAGAVTWMNGATGMNGVVSPSNSLVGSSTDDKIGLDAVKALGNGNAVIISTTWDNPITTTADVGMALWVDGKTGITGEISASNALIGTSGGDFVTPKINELFNNSYVLSLSLWDNGANANAGAVVWGNGISPLTGTISAANALVGTVFDDRVGLYITSLTQDGFVVSSPNWNNGAVIDVGAATWGSGTAPLTGVISASNSLIGSQANDGIGYRGVTALANGHYVVNSPRWDNGGIADVGAVTWGNKNGSTVGVVSPSNSMIGSSANDQIAGNQPVIALTNGHYVIPSSLWDNGATPNVGAVTWVNGFAPAVGVISASNSLIGTQANDYVGIVKALTNGNYVVSSSQWDNGAMVDVGAITLANGSTGLVGTVSLDNSLVGQTASEMLGGVIFPLANGSFIAISSLWDMPLGASDVGAAIWCNGLSGCTGVLSEANALIGSTPQDFLGMMLLPLNNGAAFLTLIYWDNGAEPEASALIYFDGTRPLTGVISAANALVGTSTQNAIQVISLPNYGFILKASGWDNGSTLNVGALVYVEPPVNRLQNAGYETAGSAAKFAANWKLSGSATSGDKRVCSKPAKPISRTEGNCIFQFNSSKNTLKARTVKQAIANPPWATVGTTLTLTADVEGVKVGTGAKKIILNVKYNNNTTDKATLTIPNGTYDYQTLVGTITLTRPVKTITVTINVGKAKGRIRVDNLTLRDSAPAALRFPMLGDSTTRDRASPFALPAAPDGFRH